MKLFRKKNEKFKTALMTSFTLLLTGTYIFSFLRNLCSFPVLNLTSKLKTVADERKSTEFITNLVSICIRRSQKKDHIRRDWNDVAAQLMR